MVAAYAALVLHLDRAKFFWAAQVAGEITKAWLGARSARRLVGRPVTSDQRVRMALWYTMAITCGAIGLSILAVLTLPPLIASRFDPVMAVATQLLQRGWAVLAAVVFAAIGGLVLLRYLLLTLFNPRR
jgi:hypothetical protein